MKGFIKLTGDKKDLDMIIFRDKGLYTLQLADQNPLSENWNFRAQLVREVLRTISSWGLWTHFKLGQQANYYNGESNLQRVSSSIVFGLRKKANPLRQTF